MRRLSKFWVCIILFITLSTAYEIYLLKKDIDAMKTTLVHERETKNTQVYKNHDDDAPIPSLYINKSAFGDKDPPKKLTIDIKEL